VGCDRMYGLHLPTRKEFQSTHPRGVRLLIKSVFTKLILFQSTHPRGVQLACSSSV